MADLKFEKETTGLLLIDPYNDFISEGGKLWDRIKGVAEANDCIPHMLQLLTTARKAGLRVFLCDASSIPSGRLRDLEVRCTCSESSLVAKDI
jgi:nicotinamidase-related amidase